MAESDWLTLIFPTFRTPEVFHQLDNYSISIKRFFRHPNFSCLNYLNLHAPRDAMMLFFSACSNVTQNMFSCRLFKMNVSSMPCNSDFFKVRGLNGGLSFLAVNLKFINLFKRLFIRFKLVYPKIIPSGSGLHAWQGSSGGWHCKRPRPNQVLEEPNDLIFLLIHWELVCFLNTKFCRAWHSRPTIPSQSLSVFSAEYHTTSYFNTRIMSYFPATVTWDI